MVGASDTSLLPASCSLLCRRIPLEEVPEDEDECSAWLHKLYQEKVSAARLGGGEALWDPRTCFKVGAPWGPLGAGSGDEPFSVRMRPHTPVSYCPGADTLLGKGGKE